MKLRRVISGGQTGADYGGLVAAKLCGLETGGFAPKGFRTQYGSNTLLGTVFDLLEHSSDRYPPRTEANVKLADATIRIATNFNSSGEILTENLLRKHRKIFWDVNTSSPPEIADIAWDIQSRKVCVLNIAGNSEETAPGITYFTINYLVALFREIQAGA